jgi:hypothetical protein
MRQERPTPLCPPLERAEGRKSLRFQIGDLRFEKKGSRVDDPTYEL